MEKTLKVCDRCLMAIESHKGKQATLTIYVDDEAPEIESTCDWCKESGFDVLHEIQPD